MEPETHEENERQSRLRRWSRRAVIEFGYLIFLLLLIEGALRVAGLILLLPRNLSHQQIELKENEYRILAIGESTTFGQGVDRKMAYPSQLEELLNQRYDETFRVINTGVPGQTSTSIVRNIRYQLETYQPHLVLALFGINDTNEALNDLSSRVVFGFNVPAWVAELRTYRLACIIRDYALHAPKIEEHGAWTFFDREQKDEDGNWIDNPFYLSQLKENTAEIIETVRASGAEYLMVSYLRSNEFIRKALFEMAEENQVSYVEVYSEETDQDELFTEDRFHPNEDGHRVIAELIFEGLVEKGIGE